MSTGGHPAKGAAPRRNRQPRRVGIAEQPAQALPCPIRQHEPGKAKRQRRLADAARPAQQQRMRQPPGLEEAPQRALTVFVTEELRVGAGCRGDGGVGWVGDVPAASHRGTPTPTRAPTPPRTTPYTLPPPLPHPYISPPPPY